MGTSWRDCEYIKSREGYESVQVEANSIDIIGTKFFIVPGVNLCEQHMCYNCY